MHSIQATRRLQQVQRTLGVDGGSSSMTSSRSRIVVLPDGTDVYVSESKGERSIFVGSQCVMGYRVLDRRAALVLAAIGTEFEKDHPVPRYNVLELHGMTQGQGPPEISTPDLWACLYALWTVYHVQENIPILLASSLPDTEALTSFLFQSGLARRALDPAENALFLLRATFWQGAGTGPVWGNMRSWLRYQPDYGLFPHTQSFTRSPAVIAQHPFRPPKPPRGRVVYRRYCSEVARMFSFRVVDPDDPADVEAFHYWMNDERVNEWWGERGDIEKHRAYIQQALDDPSILPLIMSWDGEQMGYCEMFWVKENHVAPYIPTGALDYDRGVHLLVGEGKFRGPAYSRAWIRCIHHYIFLADPRTERFIGEPKRSNAAVIQVGYDSNMHLETVFYFPYKQSALMFGLRERFFKEDMLF